MKVSLSWIRELAPGLEASPADAAAHLAQRGAPVEGVEPLGEELEDVIVARVDKAGPHPNADRLSLCEVFDGTETVQVVCGASNVQSGRYYPFAPVGATLPGGVKLKKAKIRGEVSHGMLCSPKELGLGADHQGILELAGTYEPGTRLVDALDLNDVRLDVEVTSNRPDLLSHLGVARELAPTGDAGLQLPELPGRVAAVPTYVRGRDEASGGGATVRVDDPDLCSRYLGAVIRGVEVGPSPEWLQNRLRAAGGRPINNVVDATNYVLLELGQPLHAFDLATLEGSTIVVRRAAAGETLVTLDGDSRGLTSDMLAICDAVRPVAIAGVMGGQATEVREGTTDVLLECALFSPPSVRSTRQALAMSTDASYRFERGVDPEGMERALERCLDLILSTAGGAAELVVLDANPRPWAAETVSLRPARVEHLLGVPFTPESLVGLLEPLGFRKTGGDADSLEIRVPGYRSYDVRREVDLIEEVARTHGYDHFPDHLRAFRPSTVPDHPLFALEDRLRRLLVGQGLFEVQTNPFAVTGEVELPNPVSADERFLRRELLASVSAGVQYNFARGQRHIRLFEMATVFRAGPAGGLPVEETRLAMALTGARRPPHWSEDVPDYDLWDAKGLLESVAELAWPGGVVRPTESGEGENVCAGLAPAFLLEGQGRLLGVAGIVSAETVDAPPWAAPVLGMELTLPAEPAPRKVPEYSPLPTFPGTDRDLSLLIPQDVRGAAVEDLIRAKGGKVLSGVRLLDVYEPADQDGRRSLTFRLEFQSRETTLRDSDIEPIVRRVVRTLESELGVVQRGGSGP